MLNLIRLLFALLVILLIVPQTPKENAVLRKFNESGIFANYAEAKSFLKNLTWFCIFIFLALTIF